MVLGLGRFGGALAQGLADAGHRVLGMDKDEKAIQPLADDLDEAIVADATDREVLKAADLPNTTAVFIALGDEPLRNIIATMHVVGLGAPRIIARGTDRTHARILRKLGDVQVILPEQDMGAYFARRMSEYHPVDG